MSCPSYERRLTGREHALALAEHREGCISDGAHPGQECEEMLYQEW